MHSSVDGHLVCLHILVIVKNAAMNIEMLISFLISVLGFFLGHIHRNRIAGSYSSSTFIF